MAQDLPLFTLSSSRFPTGSGEMCGPFGPPGQSLQRMPSAPAGGAGTGGNSGYHRQHSDPCMPYLQQSFKQEFLDPLYERAAHMGTVAPQRFPPAHMMVKQEPTDYTYEPGECMWYSMEAWI